MHDEQLLRLISLARKTGDTLIITDPTGGEPIVVMGISRYESLLEDGIDVDINDLPEELFAPEHSSLEEIEEDLPSIEVQEPATEPVVHEEPTRIPVKDEIEASEELPGEERFYLEPIE